MNFSLTNSVSWLTGGEEEVTEADSLQDIFDGLKHLFCFSPSSTSEETNKNKKSITKKKCFGGGGCDERKMEG